VLAFMRQRRCRRDFTPAPANEAECQPAEIAGVYFTPKNGTIRKLHTPRATGMTLDTQLIEQVQQLASESCSHRVKTLIACYVGFTSLLQSNPELKDRALRLENALREFCTTGILPLPGGSAKTAPAGAGELSTTWRIRK